MNDSNFDRAIKRFEFLTTRRAAFGLVTALGLGRFLAGGDSMAAKLRSSPAGRWSPALHRTDRPPTRAQQEGEPMQPTITHVNPEDMHNNPAFTQAVIVEGNTRTIYIGGQNAVAADGQVVGSGDLAAQTEQVFKNLETVLAASGATLHDIVKWTIFVVQGQDIGAGFGVFQKAWGRSARPPAISVAIVAGLANPEFLVEIEAIAVTGREPATG